MDEFIIFDNKNNEFIYPCEYDNCLYWFEENHIYSFDDFGDDKDFNIFWYIGKKDISNKKIYADCSIVEFDYKYGFGQNGITEKKRGYFTYSNDELCYEIIFIDSQHKNSINYWNNYISNLKIIDTIQKNKLGLIKE